jgi:hypothetical protein
MVGLMEDQSNRFPREYLRHQPMTLWTGGGCTASARIGRMVFLTINIRLFSLSHTCLGRCAVEKFTDADGTTLARIPASPRQHVILAGGFTISSSKSRGSSLLVRGNNGESRTLLCRSILATSIAEISAIALDQSPPSLSSSHIIRLAAFLTTGEFSMNVCQNI